MFYLKILLSYLLVHWLHLVQSAREPPITTIAEQGMIQAVFLKLYRTQSVIAYLGLPFAHSPVNEKRFAPPIVDALPSWQGVRNSTMMPVCWQNNLKPKAKHSEVFHKLLNKMMDMDKMMEVENQQYDEDCLYLNIFIPDAPPPPEGFAVIAWLHSGDFSSGSPFELNPHQLVFKQRVIVVSIAYRLNILGFFTSMDGESPGNFGLMDQSAALLWLKKNIKNFGGNENTITLMGHGAGAVSTTLHLTSKEWSESLFNKAIIMSGNSLLDTTVRPASFYAGALDRTATAFGCFRRPTSKLLDCLRRVSAKILVETAPDQNWGPILDEGLSNLTAAFISASPTTLIEHELLRKVPIMIGYTDMEDAYDVMAPDMMNKGISNEMYDSLLNDHVAADFAKSDTNDSMECSSNNNQVAMESVNFLYKPYPPTKDPITLRQHYLEFINDRKYLAPTILLAAHMSKQSDTYVYRFDIKPRTMLDLLPEWMGVPHGFEQIFVWGLPYWGTQNEIAWDNADKRVSDIIMTMWANFAKHTNPTQVGVYIRWETFTHDSPNLLIIDRSFNMSDSSTLNYRAIQFWNDYYPSVLAFSTQCCNMTDNEGGAGSRIIPNSSIYLIALLLPLLPFFFLHILPLT